MRRESWFSWFASKLASDRSQLQYTHLSRYADDDQRGFQDLLDRVQNHIIAQRKKITCGMNLDTARRVNAKITILEQAAGVLRNGDGLNALQRDFQKISSASENLLKADNVLCRKSTTVALIEEVIVFASEKEKIVYANTSTPLLGKK